MRGIVAGGFAVAMALAAGAAQAQMAPPIWAPAEVYVGGGALYSQGNPFGAFASGIGFSPGASFSFSETDLFGPAGFAFGGVRVPFRGMFFGIEGEYDFSGRKHTQSVDNPGSVVTVTAAAPGPSIQNASFTVGATSQSYTLKLSDRIGLFATAFVPVAGIEIFGKAGISYRTLEQSYSIAFNSPTAAFGAQFRCFPCVTLSGPTVSTADNASVSGTQHLFAPAVGGGIQIPFGNFFARIEGQADLRDFNGTPLTFAITEHRPTSGVIQPGGTVISPGQLSGGFGVQNIDAQVMLSVGYKW